MFHLKKKEINQGGTKYFHNSRNAEVKELQEGLNSLKLEKQKDAMKQIIASMTIGKDVSMLFPDVVKCIRTKNIELKKLVYLYLINYAKIKPDLIFLAVASFNTDAKEGATPLIRGLAIRTMGYIRVQEIVSYLCETLIHCFKDKDPYVRKIAALCVSKLYMTSPQLVRENGFINTLHECLKDTNAVVVANAMNSLNEISTLSGKNVLSIKSKNMKHIFDALQHANEWGQVSILDCLMRYNPKKSSHAEELIEGIIPRLNHTNPSVIMSTIKVILKFMDTIENLDKIKNYCKKISNSLMSLMNFNIAQPEIQYVLLRALHGIVQKRPMLLDKDFKFFFIQYNDPIYVKLEKVDILYKLCDNKNYDSIIKEFTSYARTELNGELIRKSVKYIGFIGYKFERSLDACVDSIGKIIDNNNEDAINESVIVARDLMRKYKGHSLDLLKKINIDLINNLTDPNSKSAAFYIVGDFCTMMKDSTKIITHFVENFSNPEIISKIKLQILNAAVKNFVNKPDEGEEIVKICLQKGAEEAMNPDVRDRAYIYWRLLEVDPDLAKDMMVSEKPPFDFVDEDDLDGDTVDDITTNMTNLSAVYLKKEQELILEEDMILDPGAEEEAKDENKDEDEEKEEKKAKKKKEEKEEKTEAEEKKEKKRKKKEKKKKKDDEEHANNEVDLMGLDENNDNNDEETNNNASGVVKSNNTSQPQQANNAMDDIFGIFNNMSSTQNAPQQSTKSNDIFSNFDYFNAPQQQQTQPQQVPASLFQNPNLPTTKMKPCCNSNGLTVYSQNQRNQGSIQVAFYISGGAINGNCALNLAPNSFGLSAQNPNGVISNNQCLFQVGLNNNNTNKKPPQFPFIVDGTLAVNGMSLPLKISFTLKEMFVEGFKFVGDPFVKFYKANKGFNFNQNEYVYNKYNNEDTVKALFEKNNINISARQNKANPPCTFYCACILGNMTFLIQTYLNAGVICVKIITTNECMVPLIKEVIDDILC